MSTKQFLASVEQSRVIQPPQLERPALKHEQLLAWAKQEWQRLYGDTPYIPVWADSACADNRALQGVKAGAAMDRSTRYSGYQPLSCPFVAPVNSFYVPKQDPVLTDSVGAYIFRFEGVEGPFDVVFAAAHYSDEYTWQIKAIALVPPSKLKAWKAFEVRAHRVAYRLVRSNRVYIVGGAEDSFVPTVEWDSVVLSDALKADLENEMDTFFAHGVGLYQELNLPAFRKMLLVGPPGTGKSMLCNALAKRALSKKHLVVYVSASRKNCGEEGADFDKIQYALNLVTNTRLSAVLIVEEIDIYLNPQNKSQILNVLDGFESPNNPRGVLFIGTTNYPEVIDQRIAKRPGRVDRILTIPPIEDALLAQRMLMRYLGKHYQAGHEAMAGDLVGQTGAFVREVTLFARMRALQSGTPTITPEMLHESVVRLKQQLETVGKLSTDEV
ncbi:MAG: hypothetical protein OHK0023_08360 [Anaerolineae bacterium]